MFIYYLKGIRILTTSQHVLHFKLSYNKFLANSLI